MAATDDPAATEPESAGHDAETAPSGLLFDNYASVIDSNLMIFVKRDIVPPFRFKAGGWELVRASIELGPAMEARIAEQGFFMCRLNADRSGWTEVTHLAAPTEAETDKSPDHHDPNHLDPSV